MTELKFRVIENTIRFLGNEVSGWKQNHREALHCADVEDVVREMNEQYANIVQLENAHFEQQLDEAGADHAKRSKQLNDAFLEYVKMANQILPLIHHYLDAGHTIAGAEQLSINTREAEGYLYPSDRLTPALEALRTKALADYDSGNVVQSLFDK